MLRKAFVGAKPFGHSKSFATYTARIRITKLHLIFLSNATNRTLKVSTSKQWTISWKLIKKKNALQDKKSLLQYAIRTFCAFKAT